MERDIDQIIQKVKLQLPNVEVTQWRKTLPADDDGLWWFRLPGLKKDIQIESPYGNCPFLIETEEQCCEQARRSQDIDETVLMIVQYLDMLMKTEIQGRT